MTCHEFHIHSAKYVAHVATDDRSSLMTFQTSAIHSLYSLIHFHTAFPLGKVPGEAALGLEIRHGQQQPQTALLAPHQNGA